MNRDRTRRSHSKNLRALKFIKGEEAQFSRRKAIPRDLYASRLVIGMSFELEDMLVRHTQLNRQGNHFAYGKDLLHVTVMPRKIGAIILGGCHTSQVVENQTRLDNEQLGSMQTQPLTVMLHEEQESITNLGVPSTFLFDQSSSEILEYDRQEVCLETAKRLGSSETRIDTWYRHHMSYGRRGTERVLSRKFSKKYSSLDDEQRSITLGPVVLSRK